MTKYIMKDRRGKRKFVVTWEDKYENIEVRLGGQLLGHIDSLEEFENGKEFQIGGDDVVIIKLKEKANILVDDSVEIKIDNKRIKAKKKTNFFFYLLELVSWW